MKKLFKKIRRIFKKIYKFFGSKDGGWSRLKSKLLYYGEDFNDKVDQLLMVTKEIVKVARGGFTAIDNFIDVDPKILELLNKVAIELNYWDENVSISEGQGAKPLIIAIAKRLKKESNEEVQQNAVYLIAKKVMMKLFPALTNNESGRLIETIIGISKND